MHNELVQEYLRIDNKFDAAPVADSDVDEVSAFTRQFKFVRNKMQKLQILRPVEVKVHGPIAIATRKSARIPERWQFFQQFLLQWKCNDVW